MQTVNRYLKYCLGSVAVVLAMLSAQAHADYKYEYTSNVFSVTEHDIVADDNGSYYDAYVTNDAFIGLVAYSPTLLAGGYSLSGGLSFSLTRYDLASGGTPLTAQTLQYPLPFSDPNSAPGSPGNPNNVAMFNIGAVNGAGVPVDWNISIAFSYSALTARVLSRNIITSTNQDGVFGGYEGFASYAGSIAGTSGTWSVSAVPEAETYAMLLAGLGLIGMFIRKKYS